MRFRIVSILGLLLLTINHAYGQQLPDGRRDKTQPLPPANEVQPDPPRPRVPLPTDGMFTPGVNTTGGPYGTFGGPPAVTLDDGIDLRKQISLIELQEFKKTGDQVIALTREISAASARPLDAAGEKGIRKKGNDIRKRLSRMLEYLQDQKPKATKVPQTAPLTERIQHLTQIIEDLRPRLTSLTQTQGTILDLRLTRSVVQDLAVAHKAALALAQ